jgi:hypothetical protein
VVLHRERKAKFEPGPAGFAVTGEGLEVKLGGDEAKALAAALQPKEGVYRASPGLAFRVVKTRIRDPQGNVVEIVG